MKPNSFDKNNWNTLIAGCLGASAISLFSLSSTQIENLKGIAPYQSSAGEWGHTLVIERKSVPYAPTFFLLGVGCLATLSGMLLGENPILKIEEMPKNIPDTINKSISWGVWGLGYALDSIGNFGEKSYSKSSQLIIRAIPPEIKSKFQSLKSDESWVKEFLSLPHQRITGGTGSGKSKLLGLVISNWINTNPNGQLFVADPNYGKPDNDGFLNNWFGLNTQWIKQKDDEIDALIDYVYEQLDNRINACVDAAKKGVKRVSEIEIDLTPICLIIEEFDSVVERLKSSPRFAKLIRIIKEGRGYKIKLIPVGQSASVTEGGFTLATLENIAQLIICYPAIPYTQLGYLKGDKDDLIPMIERLLKEGKRPAVCTIKGQNRVVVIPDLSSFNVSFSSPKLIDEDEQWWQGTNNEMFKLSLELRAIKFSQGLISSPLKDICKELGIEARSTNLRYMKYLKPKWECVLEEAKNASKTINLSKE